MSTIGVFGANGRMGRALVTVAKEQNLALTAATVRVGSDLVGVDAGELAGCGKNQLLLTETGLSQVALAEVWVDFTMPEPMLEHLALAVQARKAIVIGVTGLTDHQYAQIKAASEIIPIVWAPNMSVGVTLLISLVQSAARVLADGYDVEIIEARPSARFRCVGREQGAEREELLTQLHCEDRIHQLCATACSQDGIQHHWHPTLANGVSQDWQLGGMAE